MVCKTAPEIELCFDGGEAILLRFDIRCLANIQALDGGFAGFLKKNSFFTADLSDFSAEDGAKRGIFLQNKSLQWKISAGVRHLPGLFHIGKKAFFL